MAGSVVLVHSLAPLELEQWIAPSENQQEMVVPEVTLEVQTLVSWCHRHMRGKVMSWVDIVLKIECLQLIGGEILLQ